jgi:acyl carrier protein/NAD(P)-dependent dehydrogenase (short-subunit alcohol dehydrogenase family)
VVGGHSYGELVALHAAGRIDAETFHTLSNFRGRLMAAASQAKEAGGMLVVKASLETVEELLAKENCELVIANHNAPDQIVLAGTLEAVQKTSALFSDRSIWNRTLPVSAAFHSPLVANAREPFLARLAKAEIGEGEIPVFANSTADVYPDAADEVRDILAGQLAKPVRFVEQVQAMYECGVRTFVEVGPGNVLAGLVKAILKDQEVTVVSLDASKGRVDGMRDLALALAELAAAGHAVNLSLWDEEFSRSPDRNRTQKSKLNFPICGANQRSPKPVRPPSPARAQMPEGSVSSVPASAPAPVKSALAESHLSVSMTPHTQTGAVPPADLDQALRASREGLIALQKLQEQTGELHRKFLEGQDTALKTFLALVEQQKGLVGGATSAHPGLVRSVAPAVAPSQPVAPVRPQEVVPTPVPAAKVPSAQPASEVANVLMAVVAEKTGYPVEMLNLEMGLDSDLGIDSIKRVEIMSALQARLPDAPEIKPDQLGSLQTLQQVVDFLDANPAPAAASAASAGPAADQAAAALLEVVAEKTGYPAEMLNLEMGLDSDLGIDSIKRVEIMSALQARLPEAPEIKPDQLGSLETLQQVVDYLGSGTGAPETGSGAAPAAGLGQDQVAPVLLEIVAEKTGYPAEMLNLEMGLDSDLGIDSIKRVEIMSALQARLPEAPEIKPDQLGSLETLQQVVSFLSAAPAAATIGSVASATAAVGLDEAAVSQSLLGIVSEKTGYPVEMLNLEMGLDSDLGIDSIKRVEIMSALQGELTGVPEIKPEDLGTFQTLQNVVQFLCANGSAAGSTASGASANAIAPKVEAVAEQTLERLVVRPVVGRTEVVPDKISLEQGALVWLADDGTKLARQVEKELGMLGCQVVRGGLTALRQQALPARLGAVVILAASGPHQHEQVRDSFALMQHVSPALRRTGKTASAVFVTVSRLDGRFGLQGLNGNSNPVSGGLAGMTKTAQHEWPEVHCKAIDLDAEAKDFTKIAQAIVREVFLAGPVEVGLSDSSRCTVELQSVPMPDSAVKPALAKGEVVVVSGGGRGVTAQTALALAQACQPTLVLLGRSPNPESEPAWLSSLTDTTAIKRAIHANLNGKSTLKDVEAQFRRWMGNREVTANMRAMEQGGAKVLYRSVDIRDAAAVGSLFTELRAEHGPIRGLIHGAGVLADRKIEDKTNEQFEQVYSTKVAGLQALLQGTQKDDLKIMALFSSFTGRYGRPGQVDYAAANEVLNKLAQFESQRRPNCRVVSVNWGPWNGGMVTSALKTIFEKEGVGLIEPEAGADYLVKELSLGADGPVEVVVVAPSPGLGDFGESSVRPAEVVPEREAASQVAPGEAAIEMTVSVDGLPCLRSHVINGKAVVPAALTVEWLAHGALHGHPGMVFNGLNDFAVLKGIILGEDESLALSVNVLPATTTAEGMTVPVQLVSQHAGGTRIHARAQAVLGHGVLKSGDPTILDTCKPDRRQRKELYQNELLFHGADLEGIERLTECDATGISGTVNPAPKPASWIADPLRQSWISEPLMLDSCFQLMILWSLQQQGAHSLPTGFSKFRQYVRRFPAQPMTVRLRVTAIEQQMVRARMECLDAKGKLLASLEGYECVLDASLKAAFAKNRLVGLQQA